MTTPAMNMPTDDKRQQRRTPRKSTGKGARAGKVNAISADGHNTPNRSEMLAPPTSILRRGDPIDGAMSAPESGSDFQSPSKQDQKERGQHARRKAKANTNGTENSSTANRRNQTPHAAPTHAMPPYTQSASTSAIPKANHQTAGPPSATPVKAYAGPTFHASPAASALPLPKFFSKSVPNVNKVTTLKSMLENETQGDTSESEDLPYQQGQSPTPARVLREESPLDILFRADREAKATKTPNAGYSVQHEQENHDNHTVPTYRNGSPVRPYARHHARHHTGTSAGGMFSMEMDGATARSSAENNKVEPKAYGASAARSSPALTKTQEQLQAQSSALKQLLHSPQPSPLKMSNKHDPLALYPSLPSSASQITPLRTSARLSGNPPSFPLGIETPPDERRAALLALTEHQMSYGPSGTIAHTPSSNLRQEVIAYASPPLPNGLDARVPATPTPTRRRHEPREQQRYSNMSISGHEGQNRNHTGASQPPSSNHAPASSHTNTQGPDIKLMEDDLRRILKLGNGTS